MSKKFEIALSVKKIAKIRDVKMLQIEKMQ